MNRYAVNDQFFNPNGNIELILFVDSEYVVLKETERSGATKCKNLRKSEFEKKLVEQHYLPNIIEKPEIKLNQYQKNARDFRLKYLIPLKSLAKRGFNPTTKKTYVLLIELVEKTHPGARGWKHLKSSTISKHWREWRSSGFLDEVLASTSRKSKGASRIPPAAEMFLNHHVSTVFSNSNSKIVSGYYADYEKRAIEQANLNPEIIIVSQRTYRRRIAVLNQYDDALNNPNITEAERNQRLLSINKKIKTHVILQRVECDALHLNMCLLDDDTGKPTAPIKLYIALDVYSRIPLSVILGFDSENKEDVLNLFRHMFLSDKNIPMTGMPMTIIADNGAGFNNNLIQKVCNKLETSIIYAPSNSPAKKPFVEQFNKTFRDNFFKGAGLQASDGVSTVGFNSCIEKRTAKGAKKTGPIHKYADITVKQFRVLLNSFLTEYIHKVHLQTGQSPIERWNESAIRTPQPHYVYETMKNCFHVALDTYSGNTNKLQPTGAVRCNKQTFSSKASKDLFNKMQKLGDEHKTPEVQVFYDPWDARQITIVGEVGPNDFVSVKASHVSCGEDEKPISFDELRKVKSTSMGILQDCTYTPTGYYSFKIDSFKKQKKQNRGKGQNVNSFEKNSVNQLSVEDRINSANELNSRAGVESSANPTQKLDKKAKHKIIEKSEEPDMKIINDTVKSDDEDELQW